MNIYFHCAYAFAIRIGFLLYGNLQDLYSDVKYTDIDYQIFTDAATYIWKGESPFKRHTYRYSPILAYLMTPNIFIHCEFGKVLFSFFDIVTSLLIYSIQIKYNENDQMSKKCAFLWLYNPLAIVIATRGSSESIMTSLIMLVILLFLYDQPFFCGVAYGFAIHMKIYPCVYAATFYFILSNFSAQNKRGWEKFKQLFYLNNRKFVFVLFTAFGFLIPTTISIYLYGSEYIDEALLYHIKRKDVRHNFSPYFYFLYLSDTIDPMLSSIISFSSFFIQLSIITLISWVFCTPQTLPSCLFLETFAFVTFNKVCTSQYFLWYLCLFPLCYPLVANYHKHIVAAISLWLGGQTLWLTAAYYLEFRGQNTYFLVFLASVFFFIINILLIVVYLKAIAKSTNLLLNKYAKDK